MSRLIDKVASPALPDAPKESPVIYRFFGVFNNILRLFFNRLSNSINLITGENGGRFIQSPNALYYDISDQALGVVNTGQAISFGQTYLENGTDLGGSNTQLKVLYDGVYNFQFSGQFSSGSASTKTIYIWLRKNGTDIGYSTHIYTEDGSGKKSIAIWDFIIDMQAEDYMEIYWTADDIDVTLDATAPTSPHPGVPSAVVTIFHVSALPATLPTLP